MNSGALVLCLAAIFASSCSALPKIAAPYDQGTCGELGLVGSPVGDCTQSTGATITFLPDAKYCHLYHMCNGGDSICKYCPNFINPNNVEQPLHWNRQLNVCDYPPAAKCTAAL